MTVEKCPICNGNGLVDNGFYLSPGTVGNWTTSSAEPGACQSCAGKGYVVVEEEKIEISSTACGVSIQLEQNHGLHEPVVYVQTDNGIIPISLCDDCDTCNNTACYDIEKLRKHHYGKG